MSCIFRHLLPEGQILLHAETGFVSRNFSLSPLLLDRKGKIKSLLRKFVGNRILMPVFLLEWIFNEVRITFYLVPEFWEDRLWDRSVVCSHWMAQAVAGQN